MLARLTCLTKNKQLLELFGIYDRLLGDYVSGVSDLTATLKDSTGQAVTGFSALAVAYVAGSQGDYRAMVGAAVNPTPGAGYTCYVESTTTGLDFKIPTTVKARVTEGVGA